MPSPGSYYPLNGGSIQLFQGKSKKAKGKSEEESP
jgi:hypothetical protein